MNLILALSCLASPSIPVPQPEVRIAYVIPADRHPQDNYQQRIKVLSTWIQKFYADEMERQGFGRKTFNLELNAPSGDPAVHLINSKLSAAEFAGPGDRGYSGGAYMDHAQQALREAGFNPLTFKTVWLTFVEAQFQAEDGSLKNDTAQGEGLYGSGMAVCSGLPLEVADPAIMNDHRPYDGLVIPSFGPYKLKLGISFPLYQGTEVSSIAGDAVSGAAHELGHTFLLQHTYLNDTTQNGNLMGNGFRGWRGYFFPSLFPEEGLRLSRPNALILSRSPFFQAKPAPRITLPAPEVEITTHPGKIGLVNGALRLSYRVSQPKGPGIVLATLENGMGKNGVGVVAWREYPNFQRKLIDSIESTRIIPGEENIWRLRVFDANGNFAEQSISLSAPATGIGPAPTIFIGQTMRRVNETATFKASVDYAQTVKYSWDFGDGASAVGDVAEHRYAKPGFFEVRLTATNDDGQYGSISQFVRVKAT